MVKRPSDKWLTDVGQMADGRLTNCMKSVLIAMPSFAHEY